MLYCWEQQRTLYCRVSSPVWSYSGCANPASSCRNRTLSQWWYQFEKEAGHTHGSVRTSSGGLNINGTGIKLYNAPRVPDDGTAFPLPAIRPANCIHFYSSLIRDHVQSLKSIRLHPVSDHAAAIVRSGGYFALVKEREAFWIGFDHNTHTPQKAVRCFVSGINAVTGKKESKESKEGPATQQDYICETQPWLDGVVTDAGQVRQFVTMPHGEGFTLAEQLNANVRFLARHPKSGLTLWLFT